LYLTGLFCPLLLLVARMRLSPRFHILIPAFEVIPVSITPARLLILTPPALAPRPLAALLPCAGSVIQPEVPPATDTPLLGFFEFWFHIQVWIQISTLLYNIMTWKETSDSFLGGELNRRYQGWNQNKF
jgi:hypothetical protein